MRSDNTFGNRQAMIVGSVLLLTLCSIAAVHGARWRQSARVRISLDFAFSFSFLAFLFAFFSFSLFHIRAWLRGDRPVRAAAAVDGANQLRRRHGKARGGRRRCALVPEWVRRFRAPDARALVALTRVRRQLALRPSRTAFRSSRAMRTTPRATAAAPTRILRRALARARSAARSRLWRGASKVRWANAELWGVR